MNERLLWQILAWVGLAFAMAMMAMWLLCSWTAQRVPATREIRFTLRLETDKPEKLNDLVIPEGE